MKNQAVQTALVILSNFIRNHVTHWHQIANKINCKHHDVAGRNGTKCKKGFPILFRVKRLVKGFYQRDSALPSLPVLTRKQRENGLQLYSLHQSPQSCTNGVS